MPTRKLVQAEFASAEAQIFSNPLGASPAQTGSGYIIYTNAWTTKQMQTRNPPIVPGTLIAGHRKIPIVSPYSVAHPQKLDFYGYYKADTKTPWQTNPAHEASYCDYSHGTRLVNNVVEVIENGVYSTAQYNDLMNSAKYAAILNEGLGAFNPAAAYTKAPLDAWFSALVSAFPDRHLTTV